VPDSFGKREREKAKAKKAGARDDRRIARSQRRKGLPPVTERDRAETTDVGAGDPQP
jgi:hypothetical protein